MTDDIVTRLRNHVRGDYEKTAEYLLGLAADEIERLRAEVQRLTTATRFVDEVYILTEEGESGRCGRVVGDARRNESEFRAARTCRCRQGERNQTGGRSGWGSLALRRAKQHGVVAALDP